MTAKRTEVTSRDAGPLDAALFAALHAACFPDEAWPETALAALMVQPGSIALLAVRGTDPLAFALGQVAADECEIVSLGVCPACRRQGIGQDLLQALQRRAAAAGAGMIYLEVAADNEAARALYAVAGFHEGGRRKAYYARKGAPAVDALVLAKSLP